MKRSKQAFALCLDNANNEASLILGKVYCLILDSQATQDDMVRIVDESGENYLYHKTQFAFVDFPPAIAKKVLALAPAM